jgi:hypothetical protein
MASAPSTAARAVTVAGSEARSAPSTTLTARPRPSGNDTQLRPSAPHLLVAPGIVSITRVSSQPGPSTSVGWARIAALISGSSSGMSAKVAAATVTGVA